MLRSAERPAARTPEHVARMHTGFSAGRSSNGSGNDRPEIEGVVSVLGRGALPCRTRSSSTDRSGLDAWRAALLCEGQLHVRWETAAVGEPFGTALGWTVSTFVLTGRAHAQRAIERTAIGDCRAFSGRLSCARNARPGAQSSLLRVAPPGAQGEPDQEDGEDDGYRGCGPKAVLVCVADSELFEEPRNRRDCQER